MKLTDCVNELKRSQEILAENGHMDNRRKCAFDVACDIIEERNELPFFELDNLKNGRSGRLFVKGSCYEDVVSILLRSGYDLQITVQACDYPSNAEYTIDYKIHKFDADMVLGA